MHAEQMAEESPVVDLDTSALAALRLLADQRLPALVVTKADGTPHSILPASQVVRFLVPGYVQDDPSLARVMNESMADRASDQLSNKRVRDLLPTERRELPVVNHDDTIIEVAAIMARLRCPLAAVMKDKKLIGVISASRLLELALQPTDTRPRAPRRSGVMAVIAVLVFVTAYILIATERVPKMLTALAGAGVILGLGVASAEEAFYSHETGVDWDVIFLLLGMMIIVGVLRRTGVFEYVAIWAAKRAKGSPFRVMVLLVLITAVASAFLDNVTTVLLIAPVTLLVCDRLGVKPGPFLIAEVLASNIGGAATLIGDPPNIIIASRSGLTFNDFLLNMAPIAALCIAVLIAMLPLLFRGAFKGDPGRVADVMALNEREAITDRRLLIICGVVLAVVFVGFVGHAAFHVEPSVVALLGAGILVLVSRSEPRTSCPASNGKRSCFSPACSSWSVPWSRPGSSVDLPRAPRKPPAATRSPPPC